MEVSSAFSGNRSTFDIPLSSSLRRKLALTADFYNATGQLKFEDIGLDSLPSECGFDVAPFEQHVTEIQPHQLSQVAAAIVLTPHVSAHSLVMADELLALARFGVGYDGVDVNACTERGVAVTITKGAVDRPVAEATLAWILALAYRIPIKDRLVRTDRWQEREEHMGRDLRGMQLGLIGCGGIGRELIRLTCGFDMAKPLAYDPFQSPESIRSAGAEPVDLDQLLQQADVVSLHCPLNAQTRGLIGAVELSKMKPTAFLINTARGGLIDERALREALDNRIIEAAAIDCFELEPISDSNPLTDCEHVLLAPHSIAWTTGLFRDIGRLAVKSIVDLRYGRTPFGLVNPEVLDNEAFRRKWDSFVIA